MRVKSGVTAENLFDDLTPRQRGYVLAVERSREKIERTREQHEKALAKVTQASREAVAKALSNGVPARLIASRLGLSTARVYQMRDEAFDAALDKEAAAAETAVEAS